MAEMSDDEKRARIAALLKQKQHNQTYPLTSAQQRLWFIQQLDAHSAAYHIVAAMRVVGGLQVAALTAAVNLLVQRHAALRLLFRSVDGRAEQVVTAFAPRQWEPVPVSEAGLEAWLLETSTRPFALETGPLFRFHVAAVGQDHVILMCLHHIISDGWSMGLIQQELRQAYQAFVANPGLTEVPGLPTLRVQYTDFALWEQAAASSGQYTACIDYWRTLLADSEPLQLPVDFTRPAVQSLSGAVVRAHVPVAVVSALEHCVQQVPGCTLFMGLTCALQILLYRHTGQNHFTLGTPVAGRERPEIRDLIGFFVNTLLIKSDVLAEDAITDVLMRTRDRVLAAYEHNQVPFERLVDAIAPDRSLSHSPLFQVMFAWQNLALADAHDTALFQPIEVDTQTAKFDLTVVAIPQADGSMALSFEYNQALFRAQTIERLVQHYQNILQAMGAAPEANVHVLPMLSAAESTALCQAPAVQAFDHNATLSRYLSHWSYEQPHHDALVVEQVHKNYHAVEHAVQHLVHALIQHGVASGDRVAIALPKSMGLIEVMFATLRIGAIFVPLDPQYPVARLQYMLADCAASLLVAEPDLLENVATDCPVSTLSQLVENVGAKTIQPLNRQMQANDVAYLIYTSGSTGQPKGVACGHQGVVNFAADFQRRKYLPPGARYAWWGSFSFDVSIYELFTCFLSGGALYIMPERIRHDIYDMIDWLCAQQIDAAYLPAFVLEDLTQWVIAHPNQLRLQRLLVGVEPIQASVLQTLQRHMPGLHIINAYGPTETTVFATLHSVQVAQDYPPLMPIGEAVQNFTLLILDAQRQLVPNGVTGQLYVGGVGLAKGYWGREDLTTEKFIQTDFAAGKVYATGDLVKRLPTGSLLFMGRADAQLKLRGYRIEPGEIEHHIMAVSGVKQARVLLKSNDLGQTQLVAYVTLQNPDAAQQTEVQIRDDLLDKLPKHLCPDAILPIPQFPMTPGGKVDDAALPPPVVKRAMASQPAASQHEKNIAQVWQQVLNVDHIGVRDNFFSLGGDSISSIQVIAKLRVKQIHLSVKDLFLHPTIEALAALKGEEKTAVYGHIGAYRQLSPVQDWFFKQAFVQPSHWNQSVVLSLKNPLSEAHLRAAVGLLMTQHAQLRCRFFQAGTVWCQEVLSASDKAQEAECVSYQALKGALNAFQTQVQTVANQAQAQFDLNAGDVFRVDYRQHVPTQTVILVLSAHHLVVDRVSWQIIWDDLFQVLDALTQDNPVDLPEPSMPYVYWAHHLVQDTPTVTPAVEQYWVSLALSEGDVILPDVPEAENTEAVLSYESLSFSPEQTQALHTAHAAYRTNTQDLLLSALLLACCEPVNATALALTLEHHGRDVALDTAATVGWFTTLYPVLLSLPETPHSAAVIKQVKQTLANPPMPHLAVDILQQAGQALPQVSFNFLGVVNDAADAPYRICTDYTLQERAGANQRPFRLDWVASIFQNQLYVNVYYSQAQYQKPRLQALLAAFSEHLLALIEHCQQPAHYGYTPSDFPYVSFTQAEVDQVVAEAPVETLLPLTPLQAGMVYHSLRRPASNAYQQRVLFTLTGAFDLACFQRAWDQVIQQYDVLRTAVDWTLGEPILRVERTVKLAWHEHSADGRTAAVIADDWLQQPRALDLTQAPIMQMHWLPMPSVASDPPSVLWLWVHHHVLLDGWSMPIVLRSVFMAYEALRQGQTVDLGPRYPFVDYIQWLHTQDSAKALAYWGAQLHQVEPCHLRKHLGMQGQTASNACHVFSSELSIAATEALLACAKACAITPNIVLQAALACVMASLTQRQKVIFGVTVSGRPEALSGIEQRVGLYIQTLPMCLQVKRDSTIEAWLKGLQTQLQQMQAHAQVDLAEMQRALKVQHDEGLFDTLMVFENYPLENSQSGTDDWQIAAVQAQEETNYALTITAFMTQQLRLKYSYHAGIGQAAIMRLQARLAFFIEQLSRLSSTQTLADLSWLMPAEQACLQPAPVAEVLPCVIQQFHQQVNKTPQAVALRYAEQSLSYAALNQRSNQLAAYLRAQGILPNSRIGLCIERSSHLVVGILGILKAACAYVPLDPQQPTQRLSHILEDSGVVALLTHSHVQAQMPASSLMTLCLDRLGETLAQQSDTTPELNIQPEDEFYVIYTSGSTGHPKGVSITQGGESHLLHWYTQTFAMGVEDRNLVISSPGFDLTQKNFFAPLITGGQLLLPEMAYFDDVAILACIEQFNVTIINCAPSLFYPLLAQQNFGQLSALRYLFLGGESIHLPALQAWLSAPSNQCTLVNTYGPTECTDVATYHCVDWPQDDSTIKQPMPIGRCLPATRAWVVNEAGDGVPFGVEGELVLGGAGVGAGYVNAPALNADKFVHLAWAKGRCYRTGDRAWMDDSGQLFFVGRVDDQIKLRGLRIELGEIESHLLRLHGIHDCVVLYDDRGGPESACLRAYVQTSQNLDVQALQQQLQQSIPRYMVPTRWHLLEAFPLTANGKVDKRGLRQLHAAEKIQTATTSHVALTAQAQPLMQIWCDVLNIDALGAEDHFFHLGGHSLHVMQVMVRMKRDMGLDVPMDVLFEYPVFQAFYDVVKYQRQSSEGPPIRPRPEVARIPLSFAQERLWFMEQLSAGQAVYNIPAAIRLRGTLDAVALQASLNYLIQRHSLLRVRFSAVGGRPYQVIDGPMVLPIRVIPTDPHAALDWMAAEAAQPFDLAQGPLLRACVSHISAQESVFMLTCHHIISDGWSTGLFFRELAHAYEAFHRGHVPSLPALAVDYTDYAIWQRETFDESQYQQQKAYWLKQLAGVPALLRLPTDHTRPEQMRFVGDKHSFTLDGALTQSLKQCSQDHDVTLFMLLLAGFSVLLGRYAGQQDFCIGTVLAGRNRIETEPLLGCFINGLILRQDQHGQPTFEELLARVKRDTLAAYKHQDIPADAIIDEVVAERSLAYAPVAQVGFVLQDAQHMALDTGAQQTLDIEWLDVHSATSKYDLTLNFSEHEGQLLGYVEYNTDLFLPASIRQMMQHLSYLYAQVVANPQQSLSQYALLPAADLCRELGLQAEQVARIYALTPTQRDVFFEAQQQPEACNQNLGNALLLHDLDVQRWQQAFRRVIQQHPVLTARLIISPLRYGEAAYWCYPQEPTLPFVLDDWSQQGGSVEAQFEALRKIVHRPYALETDALFYHHLVDIGQGRHIALFRLHHLVGDGVSGGVFLQQLLDCYHGADIPDAPDFAEYAQTAVFDRAACERFWRQKLRTCEPLSWAKPAAEAGFCEEQRTLETVHWQLIRRFCSQQKITPSLYFKALYVYLLRLYCDPEQDFLIYEILDGRPLRYKKTIGCFYIQNPVCIEHKQWHLEGDFVALVQYIKTQTKTAKPHRQVSVWGQRQWSSAGAIDCYYNYYHYPDVIEAQGQSYPIYHYMPPSSPNQIHLVVNGGAKIPGFSLLYQKTHFQPGRLCDRFIHLSQQIVDGRTRFQQLNWFLPTEQASLDNITQLPDWPNASSLTARFQQHVADCPERIAVRCGDVSLSYQQLDQQSEHLAKHLLENGVRVGDRVGLCVGRSSDIPVAILAVLKAGAGYVPLDPNAPEQRLRDILEDANVSAIVCHSQYRARLSSDQDHVLMLDQLATKTAPRAILPRISADQLAYVIYTSGSTGQPKGVQVSHFNVARLLLSTEHLFGFSERDVWTLFHAYTFDFSVWEIWGALAYGGTLVVVPFDVTRSPEDFYQLVVAEKVTVLNQTPSAFAQFEAMDAKHQADLALTTLIFGGEALDLQRLAPWYARHADDAPQLVNMYGITETTVHVTYQVLNQALLEQSVVSPIGQPLQDLAVLMMNRAGQLIPSEVPGEMAILGHGVAQGYWHRAALTQARFIQHPQFPGWTLYRSGDLAYMDAQQRLCYLGRLDTQVKIRGFRIELGEIQAVIQSHAQVSACVVVVKLYQQDPRLIAYVVGAGAVISALTTWVKNRLPEYMQPFRYVSIAAIPLTVNGKIDPAQLPEPARLKPRRAQPLSATEAVLSQQWGELLNMQALDVDVSFFDLGGHSLIATQALARIRDFFGVDVPLRVFFEQPNIQALAAWVDTQRQDNIVIEALPHADRSQPCLASFAQQRLWFMDQMAQATGEGRSAYNIPLALTLSGLDWPTLHARLLALIADQSALRTTLVLQNDTVYQRVHPDAWLPIDYVDWQALPIAEQTSAQAALIDATLQVCFDLAAGPLCHLQVRQTQAQVFLLVMNFHHSIADGWSMGLLFKALTCAQPSANTPTYEYIDYALWQRQWLSGDRRRQQISYWQQQLAAIPTLLLPLDQPRPTTQHYAGDQRSFVLPAELADGLRNVATQHKTTVFVVVLAATHYWLSQLTKQADFALGIPVAGRQRSEFEAIMGLFVNTLAVRVNAYPLRTFSALIDATAAALVDAMMHQDIPFEEVVEAIQPERQLNQNPIFQVMCSVESMQAPLLSTETVQLTPIPLTLNSAKFDLSLDIVISGDDMTGVLGFQTHLFQAERIQSWLDQLQSVFQQVVADATFALPELTPVEKTIPPPVGVVAYVAPATPTEKRVCAYWMRLLGLERIGQHDDFFSLGGHSLLAVNVVNWIRDSFDCAFQLPWLFECPTLMACAAKIQAQDQRNPMPPLVSVDRSQILPLSYGQERMWFLSQLDPETSAYHMPLMLTQTRVDVFQLQDAFNVLLARHEVLRTHYPKVSGKPSLVIEPMQPVEITFSDYSRQPESALQAHLSALIEQPFDLEQGPVYRVKLIKQDKNKFILFFNLHHIAGDGESTSILLRELALAYADPDDANLQQALPIQYVDYAFWQRSEAMTAQIQGDLSYWRTRLQGLEMHRLCNDLPRRAQPHPRGHYLAFEVSGEEYANLRMLSEQLHCTLFVLSLTAWQVTLARFIQTQDILVGIPVSGRMDAQLAGVVGFFVNTVVAHHRVNPFDTFSESVATNKQHLLAAMGHQSIPFEKLLDALGVARSSLITPLFQVMFSYFKTEAASEAPAALSRDTVVPKFDLTLSLQDDGARFSLELEYRSDLFLASTIESITQVYLQVLRAAHEHPQMPMQDWWISQRLATTPSDAGDGLHPIFQGLHTDVITYLGASQAEPPLDAALTQAVATLNAAIDWQENDVLCLDQSLAEAPHYALALVLSAAQAQVSICLQAEPGMTHWLTDLGLYHQAKVSDWPLLRQLIMPHSLHSPIDFPVACLSIVSDASTAVIAVVLQTVDETAARVLTEHTVVDARGQVLPLGAYGYLAMSNGERTPIQARRDERGLQIFG